jgi:hypothetical protein
MSSVTKGKSPFYPDQPVPVDLFVGRAEQIKHIMTRAVDQAAAGKPTYVFLEGEYGIGKTSVAQFTQWIAERDKKLLGIYATLDRADSMDDVGVAVLDGTLKSGVYNPTLGEKVRTAFTKYLGEQTLFGVTIHGEALRKEGPRVTQGLLPFLGQTLSRVKEDGIKGIFLVLDEINGIANNPKFAPFLKGLSDVNAPTSPGKTSVPLLLMLVGVEDRRRQIGSHHPSVGGIFDVVKIDPLSNDDMVDFYQRAFESVKMTVEKPAMDFITHYAAGFPKIMHIIGNAAFWYDRDDVIDIADATAAVFLAADEIGKKYVDHQVYEAIRSETNHSILYKIGIMNPGEMSFTKKDVEKVLNESEKKNLNNFLQKMKKLNVLRSRGPAGEYEFASRMVRLCIWLRSTEKDKKDV